jgi:hypothetical protein
MTDPVEAGLGRLRQATVDCTLDRLESAVWNRIDGQARSDVFRGRTIQVQLAVSCAALILGILVAQIVDGRIQPMSSETAVLSDDSGLAPSVRLAGGI